MIVHKPTRGQTKNPALFLRGFIFLFLFTWVSFYQNTHANRSNGPLPSILTMTNIQRTERSTSSTKLSNSLIFLSIVPLRFFFYRFLFQWLFFFFPFLLSAGWPGPPPHERYKGNLAMRVKYGIFLSTISISGEKNGANDAYNILNPPLLCIPTSFWMVYATC